MTLTFDLRSMHTERLPCTSLPTLVLVVQAVFILERRFVKYLDIIWFSDMRAERQTDRQTGHTHTHTNTDTQSYRRN